MEGLEYLIKDNVQLKLTSEMDWQQRVVIFNVVDCRTKVLVVYFEVIKQA